MRNTQLMINSYYFYDHDYFYLNSLDVTSLFYDIDLSMNVGFE